MNESRWYPIGYCRGTGAAAVKSGRGDEEWTHGRSRSRSRSREIGAMRAVDRELLGGGVGGATMPVTRWIGLVCAMAAGLTLKLACAASVKLDGQVGGVTAGVAGSVAVSGGYAAMDELPAA